MKKRAFTLIELLVVIAIITVLLSIIVPSLRLVKQKAASVICMTNVKNMALGWYSYKEDNNDKIMSAEMNGMGKIPGWINQPRYANGTLCDQGVGTVMDEDEQRGIESGALYPYLKSMDVYNCPADKVKSLYDTVDPEKFVTYAVPTCLAGASSIPGAVITKFNEITSPSDRYNFVETAEERNFTSSGHWIFGTTELETSIPAGIAVWWGPMAVSHGDSSVLGFCDGHAVAHKWQDLYTKERVTKLTPTQPTYDVDIAGLTNGHNSNVSVDLAYMYKGWAYRYKP